MLTSLDKSPFTRLSDSKTPFQASLSTLSSWRPRLMRKVLFVSDERPTPRDGGMKLGAGALMADGAIREWRMWASDDRSAAWIAFGGPMIDEGSRGSDKKRLTSRRTKYSLASRTNCSERSSPWGSLSSGSSVWGRVRSEVDEAARERSRVMSWEDAF